MQDHYDEGDIHLCEEGVTSEYEQPPTKEACDEAIEAYNE